MKIYNKLQTQQLINELANKGKDFIFVISYDMNNNIIEETKDIDNNRIMIQLSDFSNAHNIKQETKIKPILTFDKPDIDKYNKAINFVKDNQQRGNSYLTNLTWKIPIVTNLSLKDLYIQAKSKYKIWIRDKFLCFSPETFIRIEKNIISSYPMKGTIDATSTNALQKLINNPKEAAEHATIVDLIRNDLSIVANGVKVDKYRYADIIETDRGNIIQTSSKITANVLPYYQNHIGELIFKLLPAGSITGAPKTKTIEIIKQAENYNRNFYTGIMGRWANAKLDSAVMIRFIDIEDNQLYYKAGGGITTQSNNEDEYNEIIEKIYVPVH